jgi:uncharacterized protein (TIGR03067 family)
MLSEPREALPRSSTYTLTAGQPALIDLTTLSQDNPAALYTGGIYSLQGDVLRYCVAAPGRPRPSEFATTKGDGYTLVVLKRIAMERRQAEGSE